jgi:hypothetical protein
MWHPLSLLSLLMILIQVYGRRLTALILDNAHSHLEAGSLGAYDDDPDEDGVKSSPETLPFGDSGQAKLVSVKCHKRKEQKHSGG